MKKLMSRGLARLGLCCAWDCWPSRHVEAAHRAGGQVRVEVSEELLARLQAGLPAVIAELQRRRGNLAH